MDEGVITSQHWWVLLRAIVTDAALCTFRHEGRIADISCGLHRCLLCGQTGLLHLQLLLTQLFFAPADNVLLAVQWNSPEQSFKRLKPSKALNRSAILPRYEDPLICQRICTRQTRSFYFSSSAISLRFGLSGFAPLIRRYLASRFPRPSSKSAVFAPCQHLEAYLWK